MKTILIVFFVAILLMFLLFFPFKSRLMSHINFAQKNAVYDFKIWRIKILSGEARLNENNKLVINNKRNVIKDHYKEKKVKNFARQVLKKIEVKKVELYFYLGIKDNPFLTSMICGEVVGLTNIFYGFLSNRFCYARLYEDITPKFNDDYFELYCDFVVRISLAKMFVCLIVALNESKEKN